MIKNTVKMWGTLFSEVSVVELINDFDFSVSHITFDSRDVRENSMFVAIAGEHTDGHKFINTAIDKGACVVVCSALPKTLYDHVCYVLVRDPQVALASIAKVFYKDPSSKLSLIGITGTNGKTTTATLLYQLFKKLGYKVGLISTVSYWIDDVEIVSTHTTPDVLRLNAMISQMVDKGCQYCFMEVSSHSVVQNRINGLCFSAGLFTNITLDHLDYHKTFENYIAAKKAFFDSLGSSAIAIYNADDKNGKKMVENTAAKIKSYSLKRPADYKCKVIESHIDGTLLSVNNREVWSNLIGDFNAYNFLAIYAIASEFISDNDMILSEMSALVSVRGRFETVRISNDSIAIVDYAHTPDALENVLITINKLKRESQKIFTIVGCGGDRDKTKRPIMANIAAENSDFVILTSDNPRTESPQSIIDDMLEGLKDYPNDSYLSVLSRSEAIKMGVLWSKKEPSGAILLIAGKGHETYQDINGVKTHFDDREEVKKQI